MTLAKHQQCVVTALTELVEQGKKKHPNAKWKQGSTYMRTSYEGDEAMCFIGFAFEGLSEEDRVVRDFLGGYIEPAPFNYRPPSDTSTCVRSVGKAISKLCKVDYRDVRGVLDRLVAVNDQEADSLEFVVNKIEHYAQRINPGLTEHRQPIFKEGDIE